MRVVLEFIAVEKSYRNHKVLNKVDFKIPKGEITVLIGPSGCGKTTCLKLMNRLIKLSSGKILLNGEDITKIDPIQLRRKMGYVIQQTGLFPHMTVQENIEIIPTIMKMDTVKIVKRTLELMETVRLDAETYLYRYPPQLSGGQLQRIGVARALALDPDVILMDEPFSALDPITRSQLQDELVHLQEHVKKTIVFVTHDMDEAIKIADNICIMNEGNILQFDTPENIMKHPSNNFVKEFVGAKRIWSQPEMIKVQDIMIHNPVTVGSKMTLVRAIEMMVIKKVGSLIVVDSDNKVEGVLSSSQFRAKTAPKTIVGELMKTEIPKVSPEENIVDLLKIVTDSALSSIPVVSENNILLGLITRSDLVLTLSKQFIEEDETI